MARLQAGKGAPSLKFPKSQQRVDAVGALELLLNQVFLAVFQTASVRKRFGFNHISLLVSMDGQPGWYLWFSKWQGAFLLRSLGGYEVPEYERFWPNESVCGVRLGIFYYPEIDEEVFESFSWPEKILRCGESFDETGTPTPTGRKEIPEAFFLVGHADIRFVSSRRFLELECTAPNRWRDYRLEGLQVQGSSGNLLQVVPAGGRDRNIPGWELTCFLIDKLVLGICYGRRLAPIVARVSQRQGFSCYIHDGHLQEKKTEAGISEMKLTLGLTELGCEETDLDLRRYAVATRERFDGVLIDFADEGPPVQSVCPSPWINPEWWQAKHLPFAPKEDCLCCLHDHGRR